MHIFVPLDQFAAEFGSRMNASLLVCLVAVMILPASAIRFADGTDLFEGDPCKMEDGTVGQCVRIPKCPMRMQELQKGLRTAISSGRCSFDGFVEIVCCPIEKIPQPPVVPLSITEKPLATESNPTIKSTEDAEINFGTETSTIIDRSPESMITINFTMPDFMTTVTSDISIADDISSYYNNTSPSYGDINYQNSTAVKITSEGNILTKDITKASIDENDEVYMKETSSPLIGNTTNILNLMTEASSPLLELISSTATSKITEITEIISSTTETTRISDDRFGAGPAEIALNQTTESTLGTNGPFPEEITTIDTNLAIETSPLIEMLTSTGITETLVTKSTAATNNDAISIGLAETEKYQTMGTWQESNSSSQKEITTAENPAFETISPILEILSSTVANEVIVAPFTNTTTQTLGTSGNEGGIRPAEAACNEYKKGFLNKDGKTIFLIPIPIGEPILKSGEFPFMAALGYKINKDNSKLVKYKCGGTLITTQHILTAAHCVSNADNNVPVEVRLGNVNPNEISASVQIIPVREVTVHPNYKIGLSYHNIAIIKLSTAAVISQQVMPICLQYIFIPNLTLSINISRIITGWGVARENSNDLPEVSRLRLIEESQCNNFYKNYTELAQGVDENIICLQDENVVRSSDDDCQYITSGVPLVQVNRDSINVIGIELLSQNCKSNLPGIYVNTFNYLDWIEKVVWPDINLSAVPLIDPEFDVRDGFKGENEK